MGWTAREIPDQSGRVAVVTGANSGIGEVTARELARRGARVVLACRSERRGTAAVARLREALPEADVEFRPLDLADLASVRAFAADLPYDRLDLLINNAGLMAVPYAPTADGFETQFGVNHLGHFALTGLLLERLLAAESGAARRVPRVVTVSSVAHLLAGIDPDALRELADTGREPRPYRRWQAYGRSKTANLLFTRELARRTAGRPLRAVAAHPGYAATELHTQGAKLAGRRGHERLMRSASGLIGSSPELGAAPTLYAATAAEAAGGSFTGPRFLGVRGAPGPSWQAPWARDATAAARLWALSERLTGVLYPALD